jgi:hypothetical protein
MGKNVSNATLDAALNYIKTNANKLFVLSSEPTSASAYSNMTTDKDSSGFRLADSGVISSASDFTGPADGSVSGRKLTVSAQSSMSINGIASSANATHVGLGKTSSSASSQLVIYTTTCTSQNLSGGNKVNTPSWIIEIRDPS